jgi:shikimate kinase
MIDAARTILEHARADGEAWIIYLQCSVEELERRLRNEPGDRPSLTGDDPVAEIGAVLAAREPTYRALADLELPVSAGTIDEAVASIETTLAKRSRGGMGAE